MFVEPQVSYMAMADGDEEEVDRGDSIEEEEELEEEYSDDDDSEESAEDDDDSDADEDDDGRTDNESEDSASETDDEDEQTEAAASGDDESDATDEEVTPRRSQYIPRSRFDQVNAKLKEAEQERQLLAKKLAETGKSGEDSAVPDLAKQIKDTRKKMLAAISDNDLDLADQLMEEMDSLTEQRVEARVAEQTKRSSRETRNDIEYELYVQQVIKELPIFDDEGEKYDDTLTADIMELQGKMERAGDSPVSALEHALHYYRDEIDESMEQSGLSASRNREGLRQTRGKQEEVRSKRRSGAVSKARKAESSQPKRGKGASADSKDELDFPSILRLSDEDWDKIPEKRRRAARGDLVN